MLTHTSQSTTLQNFMNIYDFKIILHKSAIIYNTQLDHLWTNTLTCLPQCNIYYGKNHLKIIQEDLWFKQFSCFRLQPILWISAHKIICDVPYSCY